jgi:signal transduction histidine kinase
VGLTRSAGLAVSAELVGSPRPLSAAADLTAFRIIQESLTNVARHAGPAATATVRLTYREDWLLIEVLDNGRAATKGASPGGSGNGIAGMRERAVILGGRLEAGPRRGGGFAVTAYLPTGA